MKVGLQLYSVRESFKQDPFGTLRTVSEAGYKYIEPANHRCYEDVGIGYGISAKELKEKCRELGIQVLSGHVGTGDLGSELLDNTPYIQKIVDYYAEVGAKYFCLLAGRLVSNEDDLKVRCDDLNRLGKLCKNSGIQYVYHNHWNEFALIGDKTVYDFLMDNTDPELVKIELDAYWAMRGTTDPVKLIRQYKDRVALLHEKDFPVEALGEISAWNYIDRHNFGGYVEVAKPEHFTEIGDGIIKVQDVIKAGNEFGTECIIVEQDHSKLGEINSIRRSMENFRAMQGLELA